MSAFRQGGIPAHTTFETLEPRTLLSLIGITTGGLEPPDINYDSTGRLWYTAADNKFFADATPTGIVFANGARPIRVTSGVNGAADFRFTIYVDDGGQFIGGLSNEDLKIVGKVQLPSGQFVDGVLLTGRAVDFGYQDSGAIDVYDFRVIPTGGLLMSFFEGKDIGMDMSSLNSTFADSFATDFQGYSQGVLGIVDPLYSSLSGRVFLDADNDGVDDSETGVAGATVTLTGTDIIGQPVSRSLTTAADGSYTFADLRPGTYTVAQTQPDGLLDGSDAAGSLGGSVSDDAVQVAVGLGQDGVGYNFGELAPASIAGAVTSGGAGIAGVAVALTGTDDRGQAVDLAASTAADGSFAFGNLRPGTYALSETQPEGYIDAPDAAGSLGGVAADDVISEIAVAAGDNGSGYSFTEALPGSLSGLAYVDVNDDGALDFGEKALAGVQVVLTGTDDLGGLVNQVQFTDADGAFVFLNLRPGTYTLSEIQPASLADGIDTLGTAGGTTANDTFSAISLSSGQDGYNYNFGERPAAASTVTGGQTATIGFWQNKNGQALINSLNGSAASTQLGNWLAATFPNMFGSQAGAANLTGKSNAQVAAFYMTRFKVKGQKLDAQVLAVALANYVTNQSLAGTAGLKYGFKVTEYGVGSATYNVGSNGLAFSVANNTTMTVMDLLLATDAATVNGALYSGDTLLRNMANSVYDAINNLGDIG